MKSVTRTSSKRPTKVSKQVVELSGVSVPLTQGKHATVDRADLKLLKGYRWHAVKVTGDKWYARTVVGGKRTYLHHFLTGLKFVDHKNGDGLDNRRSNLRAATHKENMRNRKIGVNGTSKYKGVSWHRHKGKWEAAIRCDGKGYYIGSFSCEEDAARAYDRKARELFGEFALLNFEDNQ